MASTVYGDFIDDDYFDFRESIWEDYWDRLGSTKHELGIGEFTKATLVNPLWPGMVVSDKPSPNIIPNTGKEHFHYD